MLCNQHFHHFHLLTTISPPLSSINHHLKPPFSFIKHQFPRLNHHFPMVFPWFSHGFPMVFPWFSHGFPMVFVHFHPHLFFASRDDDHPGAHGNRPGGPLYAMKTKRKKMWWRMANLNVYPFNQWPIYSWFTDLPIKHRYPFPIGWLIEGFERLPFNNR